MLAEVLSLSKGHRPDANKWAFWCSGGFDAMVCGFVLLLAAKVRGKDKMIVLVEQIYV